MSSCYSKKKTLSGVWMETEDLDGNYLRPISLLIYFLKSRYFSANGNVGTKKYKNTKLMTVVH